MKVIKNIKELHEISKCAHEHFTNKDIIIKMKQEIERIYLSICNDI